MWRALKVYAADPDQAAALATRLDDELTASYGRADGAA